MAEQHISTRLAVVYPSGMAATLSAFIHFHPRRILAQCGYHSTYEIAKLLGKIGASKDGESSIELITLAEKDKLGKGDVVWVESPYNPTGEVSNLRYYADLAHAAGAVLIVDSTFGPPPLQNPFEQGADVVMHSATKYFGGHSDLLAGVLIAAPGNPELAAELRHERIETGCVLGNMESWLLLRSLRTLTLRVERQSQTAKQLIEWLDDATKSTQLSNQEHDGVPTGILHKVLHSSTQTFDSGKDEFAGFSVEAQMPGGQSPTFSILFETPEIAKQVTQEFELVRHATSLGGVETLIEWRFNVSKMNDPRLIRVSVGLEHIDDLKRDFRSAFQKLTAKLAKADA
ncbi:PLP-dependent transferase [Ramicandelaber brevisporus]|nr:PLP-dependent transferase [Ramicandelaber brevisporus]